MHLCDSIFPHLQVDNCLKLFCITFGDSADILNELPYCIIFNYST